MKLPIKNKKILFALALALLTFLVYLPALRHELIWDSKPVIEENTLLQGDFSLTAPFQSGYWASTSQRDSGYDYYRPMMILSFMMEKAIWGLSPFRLSLLNLLIFIAALIVLYLLLGRQGAPPGTAETALVLFAFFPLNLDNILWVVGRCDLLMLLFGLLALTAFDLFLEKRSAGYGLLALTAYVLALFSKEAALFFLPVFVLLELSRRRRLTVPLHAAFLLATAAFWLLKASVIGRSGVPVHFFPSFWENVGTSLGVLGYYFRSLLFPFRYDMFLPADAVQGLPYLLCGSLFLLLLLAWPWLGRKKPHLLYAWIWIAPFLAGTLLLVFTPIYPFSISTRYLMIPAVGWTWSLSHLLGRLPVAVKRSLVLLLVLVSALAVIGNGKKYRNETAFWKSALASCPNDSFFLNKYAGQLVRDGDLLAGETLLRRALTFKMKNPTAVSIALQLAEIAWEKARYDESLDWLEKIRSLPLTFPQASRRRFQLLKIHRARGELAEAEGVLGDILHSTPGVQNKQMRVELFLAFAAWEKARQAARELEGPEGGWLAMIEGQRLAFQSLPPRGQSFYFLERGSFAQAWALWPKTDPSDVAGQLQAAKLALLAGDEAEGQRRIADLSRQGENDFRILNSLGNLLFELHRPDQALPPYRRSLRLNPGQAALRERIGQIERFIHDAALP